MRERERQRERQLTSDSAALLTQMAAARLRNPSWSYMRVELGFSFTMMTEAATAQALGTRLCRRRWPEGVREDGDRLQDLMWMAADGDRDSRP